MNDGIDWSSGDNAYWKHDVRRFEALKVILHGNSEFEANNVTIQVICDNNLNILLSFAFQEGYNKPNQFSFNFGRFSSIIKFIMHAPTDAHTYI